VKFKLTRKIAGKLVVCKTILIKNLMLERLQGQERADSSLNAHGSFAFLPRKKGKQVTENKINKYMNK